MAYDVPATLAQHPLPHCQVETQLQPRTAPSSQYPGPALAPRAYRPRRPRETVLDQVVREHLGLPTGPLPLAPAQRYGQLELLEDWEQPAATGHRGR
jgi:hypothetical protein